MKRIRSLGDLWDCVPDVVASLMIPYSMRRSDGVTILSAVSRGGGSSDQLGSDVTRWEYRPHSCETDALSRCSSASGIRFEDLDQVSFYSFLENAAQNVEGKGSMVVFYTPDTLDAYFQHPRSSSLWNALGPGAFLPTLDDDSKNQNKDTASAATTTWLQDEATSPVKTVVGRANCLESPRVCDWIQCYNPPCLHVIPPANPRLVNSTIVYPYAGSFEQYDKTISDCLWRRFGAEELTDSCWNEMYSWSGHSSLDCIQTGKRIVLAWNTGIGILSVLLLAVLARLGRGWIRKCLRSMPCCKTETVGLIVKDSAHLSKEERKAQVGQQRDCFLVACLVIGCINIFLPHLVMLVVGPVALFMVLWLWWTELRNQGRLCCRGAVRTSAVIGDPMTA